MPPPFPSASGHAGRAGRHVTQPPPTRHALSLPSHPTPPHPTGLVVMLDPLALQYVPAGQLEELARALMAVRQAYASPSLAGAPSAPQLPSSWEFTMQPDTRAAAPPAVQQVMAMPELASVFGVMDPTEVSQTKGGWPQWQGLPQGRGGCCEMEPFGGGGAGGDDQRIWRENCGCGCQRPACLCGGGGGCWTDRYGYGSNCSAVWTVVPQVVRDAVKVRATGAGGGARLPLTSCPAVSTPARTPACPLPPLPLMPPRPVPPCRASAGVLPPRAPDPGSPPDHPAAPARIGAGC
jgi:hypothetical protein